MNNQKHITMTILSIAFLLAISIRGLAIPVLAKFQFGDPLLFNTINATTLAAIVIGASTFILMIRHRAVVRFTDESWTELRRVFWPDKQETVRSTTVVIFVTLFIAFMLGLYDYVWAEVTKVFLFTAS
jgi:preprotein translocase SecE subunit